MALTSRPLAADLRHDLNLEILPPVISERELVRSRIMDVGVVPVLRTTSEEDALFATGALMESGIPIVEISATFPGFLQLIDRLSQEFPGLTVGAGSLFDSKMARRCLDAGAKFLTSDGFVSEVVEFAIAEEVAVFPGALTPTEIIAAWKTGAEFVRVTPCDAMGGPSYIRSLKVLFPQVRFIASGGVDQHNVQDFIKAGASALSAGKDLVPSEAVRLRQTHRIQELARRFLTSIDTARC
jgi:2-dehydro-3-deoxyphosphogluconate aldolase / (4S)-4-hydroxy-2-oxoglutarate aldolase